MRPVVFALTFVCIVGLDAQQSSTYRITHTYALGADGSWDYVVPDPPNHRVFIARQTRVMVVDEDSGRLLGEVPGSTSDVSKEPRASLSTCSRPMNAVGDVR
jgi:hypothetical protein